MTFRDLERRDARGPFFRRVSIHTLVQFNLARPNSAWRNVGRSVFLEGRSRPLSQGAETQRPQFWGIILHTPTRYDILQSNFAWWSNLMRGKFLLVRPSLRPWPKIFVTRMLTRDLFAVTSLLVLKAIENCYINTLLTRNSSFILSTVTDQLCCF